MSSSLCRCTRPRSNVFACFCFLPYAACCACDAVVVRSPLFSGWVMNKFCCVFKVETSLPLFLRLTASRGAGERRPWAECRGFSAAAGLC